MEYPEQAAEGGALAIWSYQDNKIKENRRMDPKLELFESSDKDAWNLARRLCDNPANQMSPTNFAQATVGALVNAWSCSTFPANQYNSCYTSL